MSEALQNFADAARRYCAWCEADAGDSASEARTASELLLQLLRAIAPLEAGSGDGGDAPEIPLEDWKRIYARFAAMPFQFYRASFDPLAIEEAAQPAVGDVADDLTDIWRDLKEGLALYDAKDFVGAAWEWRFNFKHHWGRHATGAIYPLHCWLSDNGAL